MKRIYLLMILLVALVGKATAQNTDLELITSVRSIDTMYWSTKGHYYKLVGYAFVNKGPVALTQANDTLILQKGYYRGGRNTYAFILPTAGFPVGDTLYPNPVFDTIAFTSAPTTNPYQWCDTLNRYRNGSILTDAAPTNNRKCGAMRFIQRNNVSVNDVEENTNNFAVYPNPVFNALTFKYNFTGKDVNVSVRDLSGKLVHTSVLKNVNGEKEFSIDVEAYSAGMYILELYSEEQKLTSKFTIAK